MSAKAAASVQTSAASPLETANALHQQGIAAWQHGHKIQALQKVEQAIAMADHVALFHSNLAEMNRQLGRIETAIRHGEQALALEPSLASAHGNLGIAYYDAKRFAEAEASHWQALSLDPYLLANLQQSGEHRPCRQEFKGCRRLVPAGAGNRWQLSGSAFQSGGGVGGRLSGRCGRAVTAPRLAVTAALSGGSM